MSEYAKLLDGMMQSILSGDTSAAPNLMRDKEGFPAAKQLSVYTEGYRLRLAEALHAAYPALQHFLDKDAFHRLGQHYIAAQPSRLFNLDKYPIGFAAFVANNHEDLFAQDLALLEGAMHDVYQRAETLAVASEWAQAQTLETLAATMLQPREASQLLALRYPVSAYVDALRAGEKPQKPDAAMNYLIVLRHRYQLRRLKLEAGEYMLLQILSESLTLGAALEDKRLAEYISQGDFAGAMQGWFARWMGEGILRQP